MEVSPAAGKVLGMIMAYAVSALGLLLAYYNYRKRILNADPVLTPLAKVVITGVVVVATVGIILVAAAASGGYEALGFLFGVLVPGLIVAVSVLMTWGLFRHFSRKLSE